MNLSDKRVFFCGSIFEVCTEVYEPAEDTFLLARNLRVKEGERVLDVGTGCGILAILATKKAGEVVAVDINPYALACAKRNADLNDVAAKVDFRLGDLFESLEIYEEFDLILFNAPYLPVEKDEGVAWVEKAWTGGNTGRDVIDRFITEVSKHLSKSGRILLVQSTLSNVEETIRKFLQHGLYAKVIAEEKSTFETITLIDARYSKTC